MCKLCMPERYYKYWAFNNFNMQPTVQFNIVDDPIMGSASVSGNYFIFLKQLVDCI